MKNNLQEILGLSLNESRVYQALIKGVSPDVAELKSETELPRTRIYEVLASLAAKNLLEKRSSGYRLIPPQESIPLLIEQIDKEHHKQRSSIQEFGTYLNQVWNNSLIADISPGVEVLQLEDAEPLFINHLKQVKQRVWIAAGSTKASIDMRKSGTTLATNYNPNIDVRYLVTQSDIGSKIRRGFEHLTPFQNMEIKIRSNKELHSSYVILDEIIYIFFFGGNDVMEATSLRTSSSDLVKSFNWMFLKLWEEGNEL